MMLAHQLQKSPCHREHIPWCGGTVLRSNKGQWGHLLSDEGDRVWEVGLEKIQYLLAGC